jgi:hypothetical protein
VPADLPACSSERFAKGLLMSKFVKILLIALAIALLGIVALEWWYSDLDRCLDAGGRFTESGACIGARS